MPVIDPNGATGFTPALQGATDNPSAATYTTQKGFHLLQGKICHFWIQLVTTSITKTTLTDAVRIALPFTSASNGISRVMARVTNGTPVQNGNTGYIGANASFVTIAQLPLTALQTDITYALTSLGILSNTITFEVSGFYEIA